MACTDAAITLDDAKDASADSADADADSDADADADSDSDSDVDTDDGDPCAVTLDASTVGLKGSVNETGNGGYYWLCTGTSAFLDGNNLTVYAETGVTVMATGNNFTGWFSLGTTAQVSGSGAVIYYEQGSSVMAENGSSVTQCDAIVFDTSLVTDGC